MSKDARLGQCEQGLRSPRSIPSAPLACRPSTGRAPSFALPSGLREDVEARRLAAQTVSSRRDSRPERDAGITTSFEMTPSGCSSSTLSLCSLDPQHSRRYNPADSASRSLTCGPAKDVRQLSERPIVLAGDPVLREKSKKVGSFGPWVQALVQDMLDSMRAANGLGLAAPQIGVSLRVIVIEMLPEMDQEGNEIQPAQLHVYCNPEIVKARGEEEGQEGCLSVPGYVGEIKRAAVVTVKGRDTSGRKIRTKASGLLARAFQHEIDHLDGILFVNRVESPEKLHRIEPDEEGPEQAAI